MQWLMNRKSRFNWSIHGSTLLCHGRTAADLPNVSQPRHNSIASFIVGEASDCLSAPPGSDPVSTPFQKGRRLPIGPETDGGSKGNRPGTVSKRRWRCRKRSPLRLLLHVEAPHA
eukprot:scaffold287_cov337-Pavlova_lutheri.AAC.222